MSADEQPKKRPGREPGRYLQYPHQHAVRFTEADWILLEGLSRRWKVSLAEAVRRAVREAGLRVVPDREETDYQRRLQNAGGDGG